MCISLKNGSVVANKKTLYLKKVASEIVVKSNTEIDVKDILEAVKDLPNRNRPIVARKSLPTKENTKIVRPGTNAFIKIMTHARICSGCDNPKCKKMKMIQSHFIECPKNGQNCPLCRQLIGLMSSAFVIKQ